MGGQGTRSKSFRGAVAPDRGIADPGDWRSILTAYGVRIWREAAQSGAPDAKQRGGRVHDVAATDRQALDRALGPMAEEALRIVGSFTLGAQSSERYEKDQPSATPPPEFVARLNIVLNGLEPSVSDVKAEQSAPHVIQSDLWQLLYKVRESAELSYARELDLIELDRRILFLLHNVGPLVPAEVAGSVGVDKAQVSRSVKRLLELKMVERDQIRAPIALTRKGTMLSERLSRLADLRNRELTFDVGDAELVHFFGIIESLLTRAVQLYERERSLSHQSEKAPSPFPLEIPEETRSGEAIVFDRTRIISPLMTLSSYFSRSGSLTFKRLTGLSNFEAWVLNEVAMDPPIEWNRLVAQLDRDHSQAGRTIKALTGRGLVERDGGPGRRHGRFAPTAAGRELYDIIQEASRQRSAFLLAPLSRQDREKFLSTFEKIRRNAVIQLERERAFEELDRS